MLEIGRVLRRKVLIVAESFNAPLSANGRAIHNLAKELAARNLEVISALSFEDGVAVVDSDAAIHCFFVDWNLGKDDQETHEKAVELLQEIRCHNAAVPVFLMAERASRQTLTLEAMQLSSEFVWLLEDTAQFIAGRAFVAIRNYLDELLPPFTKALFEYTQNTQEYSWAAPGHQGGVAFTKSAVGREFFDFFGENLFRTDTGIERGALGSLLDHSGPIKDSEQYAARVFGAHESYSVLNGTSGSNRAIMAAVIGEREVALCDRNCHKSIEQGLVISGGLPVFFLPTRNRYGIIGPIPPQQFTPESICKKIESHPLRKDMADEKPVYAVVTNCTYDGMCYNAKEAQDLLDRSVDRIHFDEAWYAYARFNPLYRDRFAMHGNPAEHPAAGPTVFATQSTHKLLAALSHSSYIHIRNGRAPIEHSRFNESYMLQSTTSPLYAIIAANEVGAAMVDGPQGQILTQDVIYEAVDFRQALARVHRKFQEQGDWFFEPWNAPFVKDPDSGKMVAFADAPRELLATDPECWTLKSGDAWHGFGKLQEGWCMLDPIKAGILCPGMGSDGELLKQGIPAAVLSSFLYHRGIIPSRTTDFMVLCLFSIGNTKGKWGTLTNVLLEFKRLYDANAPLPHCLPELVKAAPERYENMGLKELADAMFDYMKTSQMDKWQAKAFGQLPEPAMLPRTAFQKLMSGKCELLPLEKLAGKISCVGVIPYPPGIPIVMPGERLGRADDPWLSYIRSIQVWGNTFPGFEKEVEGTVLKGGGYHIWTVKENKW